MPKSVIECVVPRAAKLPPVGLGNVSRGSRSIVHGPETEWVQSLVAGDRVYRVRISHVRTVHPTTNDH